MMIDVYEAMSAFLRVLRQQPGQTGVLPKYRPGNVECELQLLQPATLRQRIP